MSGCASNPREKYDISVFASVSPASVKDGKGGGNGVGVVARMGPSLLGEAWERFGVFVEIRPGLSRQAL